MPRHTVSLAELATSLSEDVEFAALVEIPPERIDQVGQALQLLREEATDWKPAMGSEDPASITAAEALPHAQADEGATHTAMAIYRQMATVLPYHDVVEEGCPPISLGALELTFHSDSFEIHSEKNQLHGAVAIIVGLQEHLGVAPVRFTYWARFGDQAHDGGGVWIGDGQIRHLRVTDFLQEMDDEWQVFNPEPAPAPDPSPSM